jgi:hypothetical protein
MFKRAQTFLSLLRRKLTKALHNGGHRRHRAAAVAAAVAAFCRLRLMLGVGPPPPPASVGGARRRRRRCWRGDDTFYKMTAYQDRVLTSMATASYKPLIG